MKLNYYDLWLVLVCMAFVPLEAEILKGDFSSV